MRRICRALAVVCLWFAAFSSESAAVTEPTPAVSGGSKPEWQALSEQGQAARDAGRLDEALDLYLRAQKAAPREVLPNRGACEVELALEAKGSMKLSSRGSCYRAFLLGGSAQDLRNDVASSLSPRQKPSLDDLATASLMAEAAQHKGPDEPWGYLARCDIARRMGSADILEACLADLKQIVPHHPMTKAALAMPAERVGFGRWVARVLFLLLALGTAAHALARRWRRRQGRSPIVEARAAAIFVGVCSLLVARGLLAAPAPTEAPPAAGKSTPAGDKASAHPKEVVKDHLGTFKVDDADPEASVPSPEMQQKAPLQFGYFIQDVGTRAELAIRRGDHAAAARYFKALSKATPRSAFGPRKLCEELEASGDIATAIKACRAALLGAEGSLVGDYPRFVHVVLATRGPLSDQEHKELGMVIDHLAGEPNIGTVPATLRCQVALRFEDTKALTACTQELEKAASKDPQTVSFAWALAVQKKDKAAALKLIERGRELGMSNDSLTMMQQATDRMERRKFTRNILIAAGVALALALLRIGAKRFANRKRVSGSGPDASALPAS
jgi:hypothetical protein